MKGEKLTELIAETLIEMGLSAASSEWMMEQLELLLRDKATYKGLYASSYGGEVVMSRLITG